MMKIKSFDDLVAKNDAEVNEKRLKVIYIALQYLSEAVITQSVFDASKGSWVIFEELEAKANADIIEERKYRAEKSGKSVTEIELEDLQSDLKFPTEDPLLVQLRVELDSTFDTIIWPFLCVNDAKQFNRLLAILKNTVVPGYIDMVKREQSGGLNNKEQDNKEIKSGR